MLTRILLTLAAIQYGVVPPIVDFTQSHVFNEHWTGHARFHMVWLIMLLIGTSLYVVIKLWISEKTTANLRTAAAPGCIVLAGFFASYFLLPYYGGAIADHGHEMKMFGFDANVFMFSIATVVQAVGTVLAFSGRRN